MHNSYNGSVDTSTALYNVFNMNNIRSVATVDGSVFYVSGQGVKGDTTQGVFVATDGASTATMIDDATDTRVAEIYNGVLYVSQNSSQGTCRLGQQADDRARYGFWRQHCFLWCHQRGCKHHERRQRDGCRWRQPVSATILSGGGSDTGTMIQAGGSETVSGSATGDSVGGAQLVVSGGTLTISGNTSVNDLVVTRGGMVVLDSPKASIGGTFDFTGAGTLVAASVASAEYGEQYLEVAGSNLSANQHLRDKKWKCSP